MKKMENKTEFSLWTPWGPQYTRPVGTKTAALRGTLKRLNAMRAETDRRRENQDPRVDKPECAYEP